MKWIKELITAATGGFWGYFGALLIGAGLGGAGAYYLQGLRLEAAVTRADAAEDRLDTAQQRLTLALDDAQICAEAAQEQNKAIEALEKRAKLAEQAMAAATVAREAAEKQAANILRERTPAGADKCMAARDAFAAELREERGQ